MMLSNSLGLQAKAKKSIYIKNWDDLSFLNALDNEPVLILGAGTNVILGEYFDGTVIEVHMQDIKSTNDHVSVDAGLDWADLIEYCLKNELYGLENLTHIPGKVGAAPVQNIGAYGVEISTFIHSIECFNLQTKQLETLQNNQCLFSYRQSIFQSKNYIILRVNFSFSESFEPNLSYPALNNFLCNKSINKSALTPRLLSDLIKEIRNSKLPDPALVPNVGSVFKNPIVNLDNLDHDFLIGHRWDQGNGYYKLSAAKLIELIKPELIIPKTLNFYENHSLVLINNGGATFNEVTGFLNQIQTKILEKFKIKLEIEPEIIPS